MPYALDKRLLYLVLFFSLPLLFLPKINLISFENQTAGVRIDDFILFGTSLFIFGLLIARKKKLEAIEKGVVLITIASLLSFMVNRLLYSFDLIQVKSSLFYCLRLPEYFVYFYLGQFCSRVIKLKTIILLFVLFNACLMLLQKGGFLGQVTAASFVIDTGRVSGIASFPSEMGALLSMIFCYLIFENKTAKFFSSIALFFLFGFLILLTGSRLPLAVLPVALLIYQYQLFKGNFIFWLLCLAALALVFPLAFYVIINSDSLVERSLHLLSLENLHVIAKVWDFVDIDRELYDNIRLESGAFDLSWLERLFKWCYALKMYLAHPLNALFGVGPGCFYAAVDGSFIRILTENGLLGLCFYFYFFRSIYLTNQVLPYVLFAFAMNMIFFDIYLAYKPMSLLLLMTGYYIAESRC